MTRLDELRWAPANGYWDGARVASGAVYRAVQDNASVSNRGKSEYHNKGELIICDQIDPVDMARFQDRCRIWTHLDELTAQAIVCHLLGEGTDEN